MLEIEALLLSERCWGGCRAEQSIVESERLKRSSSSESRLSFWNEKDTNLSDDERKESAAYFTTRTTGLRGHHWRFVLTWCRASSTGRNINLLVIERRQLRIHRGSSHLLVENTRVRSMKSMMNNPRESWIDSYRHQPCIDNRTYKRDDWYHIYIGHSLKSIGHTSWDVDPQERLRVRSIRFRIGWAFHLFDIQRFPSEVDSCTVRTMKARW